MKEIDLDSYIQYRESLIEISSEVFGEFLISPTPSRGSTKYQIKTKLERLRLLEDEVFKLNLELNEDLKYWS